MRILFFEYHVFQMATIDPDTLFKSITHVLKNAFIERLGNPTDFCSNIFFKLCHSVRICFVNDKFKCPHKKKSHGVKSGDLGGHGMAPFREMFFSRK